jgi:hypothetical protein
MKLEAGGWKLLISGSPPSGCERNPAPRRAIRQRLPVTAAGSQTKSKFSHGQNVPSVTPMPNLAPGCIRSALKTPAVTTSGPLGRPGRAFETAEGEGKWQGSGVFALVFLACLQVHRT